MDGKETGFDAGVAAWIVAGLFLAAIAFAVWMASNGG